MTEELTTFIPNEVKEVLGQRWFIDLQSLVGLEKIPGCKPDTEPGVYLGIGVPKVEKRLPCLYVGSGAGVDGPIVRVKAHLSSRNRKGKQSSKVLYILVDDPSCPRPLHFLMLAKVPRDHPSLQLNGGDVLSMTAASTAYLSSCFSSAAQAD